MGADTPKGNPAGPSSVAGKPKARMIYAASDKNADMLYATGVFVPDPFLYLRARNRVYLLVNAMELARVKREARADRVFSYDEIIALGRSGRTGGPEGISEMCMTLFRTLDVARIEVPASFPLGLADELRKRGMVVQAAADPFFPGRAVKNVRERAWIRKAQEAAAHGMRVAWEALKSARVKPGRRRDLVLGTEPLTSERVQSLIQKAILDKGCVATQTIVAGGRQGADPHERGRGALRAGEPIIVDIFPRCEVSGYHGDMTRTFLKGVASERIRGMYHAVREAQVYALSTIRPGALSRTVHRGILELFRRLGFPKREEDGRTVGFIHGTGHGLGLDVHEHPRLGERSCRLREGNVVTVEPGLYYPDVGGIRLEDVVWIGRARAHKIGGVPYVLEIP